MRGIGGNTWPAAKLILTFLASTVMFLRLAFDRINGTYYDAWVYRIGFTRFFE